MTTFTANAQSSSAIEVEWNLEDVDPGHEIVALTITQTAPNGASTPQNFQVGNIVQVGTTVFAGLQPATTYSYVIDAVWEDGSAYNPQPGITCATLAAKQSGSSTSPNGGGTLPPQVPLPPDKITGLTASWNAPAYTEITVGWVVGADTTGTMVKAVSGSGKTYVTNWSTLPFTSHTQGMTGTLPVPPDSYTITVIDSDGASHQSQTTASVQVSAPPGPGKITGLTAAWNNDYTAIVLTWSQGSGTATTGMQLQRYPGQFSPSATAQETIKISPTSPYTDTPTTISASSQYQYQLTATNAFGSTAAVSNLLSPPKAPPAPSHVVAKWIVNYSKAEVSWDASAHAANYEVLLLRTDLESGPTQMEDHTNIQSTSFQEALAGHAFVEFQYRVIAHNRFGSAASTLSNGLGVPYTSPQSSASGPPPGPHGPVIRNQSP